MNAVNNDLIALLQAGRAWAALEGRDHVIPEDIQAVLVPVCAHRLRPLKAATLTDMPFTPDKILRALGKV